MDGSMCGNGRASTFRKRGLLIGRVRRFHKYLRSLLPDSVYASRTPHHPYEAEQEHAGVSPTRFAFIENRGDLFC